MPRMTSSSLKNLSFAAMLLFAFLSPREENWRTIAQTSEQVLARSGHVNDFAGIIDKVTKHRLETILANVLERSGIEFNIAVVETTGSQDIFTFSRDLAHDWRLATRTSVKKSLLLVVSVNEKVMFTQFSRSVQGSLPEGVLGEMAHQMREHIGAGRIPQALNSGVEYFINRIAMSVGFTIEGLDQEHQTASVSETPATVDPSPDVAMTRERRSSVESEVTNPEASSISASSTALTKAKTRARTVKPQEDTEAKVNTEEEDADEAEEVELTLTLPLAPRITRLQEFLETMPTSKARPRAWELLISAHATLGDEKLKTGESEAGIEQMMLAIDQAPQNMPDKLYLSVVNQIPGNLYLRNERAAAFNAARKIEAKFGKVPRRLVALAGFYLGIEHGDDAARLAKQALEQAPEMAEAHHALGAGLHLSLRLEDAAAEYRRALELDPKLKASRRSLADVSRALGKSEEALALYREYLAIEPTDKHARAGLVVSLLELGMTEEADKELSAALQDDPKNLALLVGTAYWFAAHGKAERGLELAVKAVELEPRYTWSQIALARSLIVNKSLTSAERALRFARQYGKFPTLDYELANVLAASGLYDEAVEVLLQSFTLKDGQIETKLAGHVAAREPDFVALLAPERRASIFQSVGADHPENASMLKRLLAFTLATRRDGDTAQVDESLAISTGKEFASGEDVMSTYRRLYVASRLVRNNVGLETAYSLVQEAKSGVEAAVDIPEATVAAQADEFRDLRARAIASGGTPSIEDAPKNVLSNILRGRIEDISGWALFNQNQPNPAIEHLRLAINILPEGTPSWRSSLWHLGAALEQAGQNEEALNYYIKSYNAGEPDSVRHSVIEQLYQKTNGSLEGFEKRLSALETARVSTSESASPEVAVKENASATPSGSLPSLTAEPAPTPENTETPPVKKDGERDLPAPAGAIDAPSAPPPSEMSEAAKKEGEESSANAAGAIDAPTTPQASTTTETTKAGIEENTTKPTPAGVSDLPTAPPPSAMPDLSVETVSMPEAPPSAEAPPSSASETPASPKADVSAPSSVAQPFGNPLPGTKIPDRSAGPIEISGRVMDSSGSGISNAVIVLISQRGSVMATTTDAGGNYSFAVTLSRRNYRIIPSKDGYTFEPFDKILPQLSANQKAVDFVATPRQ